MSRLFTLGVGLLSAAFALPAIAADMPVKEPRRAAPQQQQAQPQRQANWNGGQLGGSNGLSSVNNNFVEPGAYLCGSTLGAGCFETPFSFSGHSTGYTVGPFLGYRWQWGMYYVVGVEADWMWKKGETSFSQYIPNVSQFGFNRTDNKSGTVSQNWDSSFRLRYGYLVTTWTLLYATGGLAIGEVTGNFYYNSVCTAGTCFGSTANTNSSWSDVRVGGTVGAGVETEVWSGWKARVEYRYTDFGTQTKTVPLSTSCVGCFNPSSSASIDLRESFHKVTVGLGFDF